MADDSALCPGPRICHTTCFTGRRSTPRRQTGRGTHRNSLSHIPAVALDQHPAHVRLHGDRRSAARDADDPAVRRCSWGWRSPGLGRPAYATPIRGTGAPRSKQTTDLVTAPRPTHSEPTVQRVKWSALDSGARAVRIGHIGVGVVGLGSLAYV